ncbi:MAG: hypothetical protein ABL962_11500 [Fimbriimonadaceae bacterium]
MRVYTISYDLDESSERIDYFFRRLGALGAFPTLNSQWVLRSNMSATQLRNELGAEIDGGRLLITEVGQSWALSQIVNSEKFIEIAPSTTSGLALTREHAPEVSKTHTVRVDSPRQQVRVTTIIGDVQSLRKRFLAACELHLVKNFEDHEEILWQWYDKNLSKLTTQGAEQFVSELERSVTGTPRGRQRRASSVDNSDFNKLLAFLGNLMQKIVR